MPIKRAQIERALKSKGFVQDDSSHHRYFHHEVKGRRTGAYAYTSRGTSYSDYSDSLIGRMKHTLKLDSTKEAIALLDCTMTADGYNSILQKKGLLDD